MHNQVEAAQRKFVEGVGRISDILGINRFIAQLYAFLYFSPKARSLDEIVEALGVSKGNVSVNIRELEKWGAVRNVWVRGSRKDFYQVDPDIKKVFLTNVKSAVQKRTGELTNLLEEFIRTLESLDGDPDKEETELIVTYKERLAKITEIKNQISTAVELINKFL